MVNRGTEKKGGKKEKREEKINGYGAQTCVQQFTHQRALLLNHCNKVATQAVLSYFDVLLFFSQRVVQRCAACPFSGDNGDKITAFVRCMKIYCYNTKVSNHNGLNG